MNATYACTCGRAFPGTLAGAWDAKQHADLAGHHLAWAPGRIACTHVAPRRANVLSVPA
jgi:hypothetical protein